MCFSENDCRNRQQPRLVNDLMDDHMNCCVIGWRIGSFVLNL